MERLFKHYISSLRARRGGLNFSFQNNSNRVNCSSRAMMRFLSLAFLFLLSPIGLRSQDIQKIKIKKEKTFLKAEFDETSYKVVAIDKYGNPHEEVIKSFVVSYSENGNLYEAPVVGNTFPDKTINFLTKKKKTATKVCLRKIKAEDSEGHLEDLPDLCNVLIFPDCKNCKIKVPKD
jgi:hypothetical protein